MKHTRFVSLGTIRRAGTVVLPAVLGICVFLVHVFLPLAAVSHGSDLREGGLPPGEAGGANVTTGDGFTNVYLGPRRGSIWVHVAPDGRRFTLRNPDGRVLAENLTEKDLRADFPEQWETIARIEHGLANPGVILDVSGPAEWFLDTSRRLRFQPLREAPRESHAR